MKRNVWHGNNASVRLKKKSGHWPVYEQHDKSMGWNETQKCQPCHVPPLPCQPIAPGVLQRNSGFAANFLSNIARGTTDPEIDSVTWTKFGNNMASLAFVTNSTTNTCISCKFGHQMVPLALLPKLATRLRYLHCYIAMHGPICIIS